MVKYCGGAGASLGLGPGAHVGIHDVTVFEDDPGGKAFNFLLPEDLLRGSMLNHHRRSRVFCSMGIDVRSSPLGGLESGLSFARVRNALARIIIVPGADR